MAQVIKIKRGGIVSLVASTPTLQQGELLLATGSVNGLGSTFFVADGANTPELPYAKVESISDGPALASSLDDNFEGLLIHSASDNKLYRYNGSAFVELPIAAGSFVGTLPVANGGTNATSFADKAVIISQDSGTDTLSALTLTTSGQLVIGGASGPAAATLTAGAGIDVTNGDGSITIAAETATDGNAGIVELATTAEVTTGTDTARAVTPDALKDGYQGSTNVTTLGTITTGTWQGSAISTAYISNLSGTNTGDEVDATTSTKGIVELATTAEVTAGTSTTLVVTPDGLKDGYQGSTNVTTLGTITSGDVSAILPAGTVSGSSQIAIGSTTGTLAVNKGGTGATSLSSGQVLIGNGTSAIQTRAIGIADNNIVEIDDTDAADNDYAKFTANGLEGRSYSEVKTDLSLNNVENTALSTWTGSSNITHLGTISTGVWQGSAISTAYISNLSGTNTGDEPDASTSTKGIVELATTAETTTGTSTTLAVTPDGLKDGYQGSTNVTTLGTISTGTWQGTAIADGYISSATTWNNKLDSSGTITTNDYAKFNASGDLVGRSYSEVKSDLSLNNVENTALSTWGGSSNITTIGTVTSGDVSAILPAGSVSSSEQIQDIVGGMVTGNTETLIAVTYVDGGGKLSFVVEDDLSQYDNTTSGFYDSDSDVGLAGDLSGTAAAATVTKVQGVSLTSGEATQLANINSVTISNTQWGYLGSSNQGIATSNSPTFAGLTVTGDLSVQGTLTTVSSNEVQLGDRIVTLNTADGAGDAGIQVHDTNTAETGSLLWDTDGNYWKVGVVGGTDYRLVEWDGETATTNSFIHTDSNGRINAITTSTDGDILVSNGSGTFTATNVIDGGTY